MIKLSILICSTHTRRNTFLPKCLDMVYGQYESLSSKQQEQVEIIVLVDNKKMMLGDKRNKAINISQGEYYSFIDDDDRISGDYILTLLNAINEYAPDVITFLADVSINGDDPKPCRYSIDYVSDQNTANQYNRLPNHICCVKSEIGKQVSFPNIKYGEDSGYSKLLRPLLNNETHIPRALYYYDFNSDTTETQEHLNYPKPIIRKDVAAIIDVVILSNSYNESYKKMCQYTIDTCISGANGLKVNVIVIEQAPCINHKNATTILTHEPFNYNAFMNKGAKLGKAKWILMSNNDLVFRDGWLHHLLAANHPVVSPHEPNDPRQRNLQCNETGYQNGRHLSGWCYMIKRETWEQIGGLDEEFIGWFADDSLIQQVKAIGVAPMIVKDSHVHHLGSKTLSRLDPDVKDELCWSKLERFNEKYGQSKFVDNPNYLKWKRSKR